MTVLEKQELIRENSINSLQLSSLNGEKKDSFSSSEDVQSSSLEIDIDRNIDSMEFEEEEEEEAQNIYFNDIEFNELLEYSSNINSKIYPSSWFELNDQLFCPIKYSQTFSSQNIISNGDEKLLKILYSLQFKSNCFDNDKSNKFLIFDMKTMGTRGLGAVINAGLLKIIFRAIYSNRTLILHGKWMWTKGVSYCKYINTTKQLRGMNCYMLPTSNCNYDELIKYFGTDQEYKGRIPSHCNIGDNKSLPFCKERIIHINKRNDGWGYFPMPSFIDKWLLYKFKINYNTFRAVVTSFVFRLKSNIRNIIYNKIRNAFKNSLNNKYINPFNTISLPIRHSDKCRSHIGGEMECWTINEYILFLETLSFLSKDKINTVIITSESTEFVNNLTAAIISYENKWKYSTKYKWKRIIINNDDISSQVGAADYIDNNEKYSKWIKYKDNRLRTKIEYDPIVGALSSMLLQISNSKYIVHTKSSNWLDLIWALAQHLNCHSIFWSKQFQINSFIDNNNNNNKINIEKRPKFMYNINKKYLNFEKYCFEFNQWGLANKMVFRKSITYPPDLWETIKTNFNSDSQFEKKFGIRAKTYKPCSRYDMHPFQRSDTLY